VSAFAVSPPGRDATSYVVLDDDDRIVYVGQDLADAFGPWLGHVLWEHLPEADAVYGPCLAEARATGQAVESVVFYNGGVKRLRAVPAADGVALHVERLAELDVRTLGTLVRSLRLIEGALAAPAPVRPDPRAHGSPRALP
jgi:hypothetical protein